MVLRSNSFEVIYVYFLILVITSINLEVLALTNMENFMCAFFKKEIRFSTSFQH